MGKIQEGLSSQLMNTLRPVLTMAHGLWQLEGVAVLVQNDWGSEVGVEVKLQYSRKG